MLALKALIKDQEGGEKEELETYFPSVSTPKGEFPYFDKIGRNTVTIIIEQQH